MSQPVQPPLPGEVRPLPGEVPPRKSHACLYGCLIALVVFFVMAGLALFGVYQLFGGAIETYTDTEAAALPPVEVSPEHAAELESRVEDFMAALDGTMSMNALVLTGNDINVLIRRHPDFKELGESVYVSVEGESIKGEISLPLDVLEVPDIFGLKGRYLNGSATFTVNFAAGRLSVFIEDLSVRGQSVPEQFMGALRQHNLAQGVMENPEFSEVFEHIDRIAVEDSMVKVMLKEGKPQ